jgi:hypothetical protein
MDKFKSIFLGLEIAYGQYQPGERGENGKQKGKAFIVRGTSPTIYGATTLKEKALPLASSLLLKTIVVVGGVLILTSITLTTLASLKVFENLTSL